MANHEELISQFEDVTGVDAERAKFYLESSAWQLEVALASFYENDEAPVLVEEPNESFDVEEADTDDLLPPGNLRRSAAAMDSSAGSDKKSKSKQKPKFSTIRDLNQKDSSSEEEEGQAFYAGGSEHGSGQQIVGRGKKNKDIISDMFKMCQDQSIPVEQRPSGHQQRPTTFSGTGYKLGQTSSEDTAEAVGSAASSSSAPPNSNLITLKLWQDGFTINDQELRSYNDPKNKEFLEAIKRGEIPMEIRQELQSGEVRLDMEDHRHEEYVPPKVKVKAFTGKGHMLGSPSPAAVGMTIPVDPADQEANEAQARRELNLDSESPVTTLQIRLADGSNVRVQFNLSHTIGDIRRYITTMRPQYAIREFSLLTTYPTKELSEDSKTIQEAGLANSAIMQRLK